MSTGHDTRPPRNRGRARVEALRTLGGIMYAVYESRTGAQFWFVASRDGKISEVACTTSRLIAQGWQSAILEAPEPKAQ